MDLVKVLYQWKKGKSKKKKPLLLGIQTLDLWNRSLRRYHLSYRNCSVIHNFHWYLISDWDWLEPKSLWFHGRHIAPPFDWPLDLQLDDWSSRWWWWLLRHETSSLHRNLVAAMIQRFFTETCTFDELSRLQTKLLVPRSLPFSSSVIILIQSYFYFFKDLFIAVQFSLINQFKV